MAIETSLPVVLFALGAAPVINSFLASAVGGIIGNRADWLLCRAFQSSRNYFEKLSTDQAKLNHDLARATRKAYLVATSELLRHAQIRSQASGSSSTFFNNSDPQTLAKLLSGLEADFQDVENTLPTPVAGIEALLLDPETAPAQRRQKLFETLNANLLQDFNRWAPNRPMPPAIQDLLVTGWNSSPSPSWRS